MIDLAADGTLQEVLFVCSAGNDATDADVVGHYPSGFGMDNLLAVAASGRSGALSGYTNWGSETIDMASPGDEIWSTFPENNYKKMSGSSMAAPQASGKPPFIGPRARNPWQAGTFPRICSRPFHASLNLLPGKLHSLSINDLSCVAGQQAHPLLLQPAGAAALLLSVDPSLSASEVKRLLLLSAVRSAFLEGKVSSGGRLHIGKAVSALLPIIQEFEPGLAPGGVFLLLQVQGIDLLLCSRRTTL